MSSNFKNDLSFGNKYEQLTADIYKNRGYNVIISEGKFKPYDIKATKENKTILIEVKADRLTAKTGNVCIEFECSNKPSGISTTEAKYYFYYVIKGDNYDVYKIKVSKIKKMIKNKKYIRTLHGGDNKSSKFYLFKINHFEQHKLN